MYIISGRGRKSGVARATGATASLAPMFIELFMVIGKCSIAFSAKIPSRKTLTLAVPLFI